MSDLMVSKNDQLSKLYTRSTSVDLGRDDVELVAHIRKLTVIQEREASRESLKKRAVYEHIKRAPWDDPDRLSLREVVSMLGDRDDLARFILGEEELKIEASVSSRIANEERWSENSYLETLQRAWADEMKERFDRDPEDPEAKRIFEALQSYVDEVIAATAREFADVLYEKLALDDDSLIEEAVSYLVDRQALSVQSEEFNWWKVYFCTFEDEDYRVKWFRTIEEVRETDPTVIKKILQAYDDMSLGVEAGKE